MIKKQQQKSIMTSRDVVERINDQYIKCRGCGAHINVDHEDSGLWRNCFCKKRDYCGDCFGTALIVSCRYCPYLIPIPCCDNDCAALATSWYEERREMCGFCNIESVCWHGGIYSDDSNGKSHCCHQNDSGEYICKKWICRKCFVPGVSIKWFVDKSDGKIYGGCFCKEHFNHLK